MSAKYDSFRSILDQLMGGDRDLMPEHKTNRQMHFSDDKVCKFYICGLCPHELFTNTKSDLGPCAHLHDDDVKAQYDQLPFDEKMSKYPYERDFIARMQKMIADLDKRIDRGHQRLSLQDHENPLTPDKMEKLDAISEQIEMLLRQMEELGAAGRLQEAQNLELQIFKLKAEQEATKKGAPGGGSSAALAVQQQDKRLKVCEICGAFLVVGDTDDRIKSHNDGKQHQGYSAIRTILDEKRKNALSAGQSPVSRAILRDDRSERASGGRDTRGRDSRRDPEPPRGGGRFAQGDSAPRSVESYSSSSSSSGGRRDRDDRERAYYASRRDHHHHHHHSRDRERDRDQGRYRDRDRRRRERSPEDDDEEATRKRERERDRELPRPTDNPAPEDDPRPHHPPEPKRRRAQGPE